MARSESVEILPLTSMRFVAALYVYIFHIHIRWPLAPKGTVAAQILSHGATGMSLFFILSGVVLGYRFSSGVRNWKSYAFSRFTRIYPVYFLAALVTVPWLIAEIDGGPLRQIAKYVFIVGVDLALIQAWFPQLFEYWNNGGSWSISVEAFFYVLFPLVVGLLMPLKSSTIARLAVVFYVMSAIAGISAIVFPSSLSFSVFYAIPIFRLGEFLIGVSVGLLFARGVRMPRPEVALVATIAALALYLSLGPNFGFQYITDNFVVVPLIGLMLFSCASLTKGVLYRLLSNPVPVFLGHISYSFCSFQALVLRVLIDRHAGLLRAIPALKSNWVLAGAAGISLAAIAALSFTLVEKRFRRYLHRQGPTFSVS